MSTVNMPQKKQGIVEGFAAEAPAMAGRAIGTAFGGPVGGAIGGKLGSTLAPAQSAAPTAVDRRMSSLSNDPANIIKQGKAELASADEGTRAALEPVLEEALRRATLEKQKSGGLA